MIHIASKFLAKNFQSGFCVFLSACAIDELLSFFPTKKRGAQTDPGTGQQPKKRFHNFLEMLHVKRLKSRFFCFAEFRVMLHVKPKKQKCYT